MDQWKQLISLVAIQNHQASGAPVGHDNKLFAEIIFSSHLPLVARGFLSKQFEITKNTPQLKSKAG